MRRLGLFLAPFMLVAIDVHSQQVMNMSPLLNMLGNGQIGRLASFATELATTAAVNNPELQKMMHRDFMNPTAAMSKPLDLSARPSEMISQSVHNMISPGGKALAAPTSAISPSLSSPSSSQPSDETLMNLAEAFLGGSRQNAKTDGVRTLPTIRELAPSAKENFGMPRGEGCLPFLGEFMNLMYGNCARIADEKTWDMWGGEINKALSGRRIDLLGASKETCKRGAERQQCVQLRRAISHCDILGSIQIGSELQRAIKRCDEISGILDQNPIAVFNQMNSLIGQEFAQGMLSRFLG